MLSTLGASLTGSFKKFMPDAFVFALALTLITATAALIFTETNLIELIQSWYQGFWMLLEFGMQMVLILVTGYSIALSPLAGNLISRLTKRVSTPRHVYLVIMVVGILLSFISWGWVVITAVLARELAMRVKGLNYPYLVACVYFSGAIWVTGLSSSIPLLLNTQNNYLIEAGILKETISTSITLGSVLNKSFLALFMALSPLLFLFLAPKKANELQDLIIDDNINETKTIEEEATSMNMSSPVPSDRMNNSPILQYVIAITGIIYVIYHFTVRGMGLDLNIMIFIFIMLGLLLHKSPMRYGIAMKRSSMNISGILFQFPFYAGIMGIMMFTGLGDVFAQWMASASNTTTYPIFAYLCGAIVNFAIPSAGGEFAVIGPSTISAITQLGAGLPEAEVTKMIARASLSVAYGESLTNALQPFYLLIILPVMGIGTKIQARDVMGFLLIPFLIFFVLVGLLVVFVPL